MFETIKSWFAPNFKKRLDNAKKIFSDTVINLNKIQDDIFKAQEKNEEEMAKLHAEYTELRELSRSNELQIEKISQFI